MNTVILMGRLTADPTLTTIPQDTKISRFTIAVDRKYQKDKTDFINCVAWNNTAVFIHNYFGKGKMIAVEGELQTRTWDGTDGKRQYATEVNVSDAFFCGSKKDEQGNASVNNNNWIPVEATAPQYTPPQPSQESFVDMDFGDTTSDMDFADVNDDDLPFPTV